MQRAIVVFLTALALTWLGARAVSAKAKHEDQVWVFEPIGGVIFFYCADVVIAVALLVGGALGPRSDRAVVCIGSVGLLAFAFLTWPKAVYLLKSGLRQRAWNMKWKAIEWSQAPKVEEKKGGSVFVRAGSEEIVLSGYHAGRSQFLEKLDRYLPAHSGRPEHGRKD